MCYLTFFIGNRSGRASSSKSRSERKITVPSSFTSYRVVESREKEKRYERSHGDRTVRKSRSSKKEKDKRKERKRLV